MIEEGGAAHGGGAIKFKCLTPSKFLWRTLIYIYMYIVTDSYRVLAIQGLREGVKDMKDVLSGDFHIELS